MKREYTVVKKGVITSLILQIAIVLAGCGGSDVAAPSIDTSNACVDYTSSMHWSGRADTGGGGAVVPGVSVYPGAGGYFMTDAAQNGQVSFVASDRYTHVVVVGPLAYRARTWPGLAVLDVSSPSSPVELATLNVGWRVDDIAVSGSFAYLSVQVEDDAGEHVGLQIVDVSNPHAPVLRGQITWDDPLIGHYDFELPVSVAGSHVYMAAGNYLQIVDVSNPAAPALASRLRVSSNDVVVVGSYAYVAGYTGLHVVDVAVPHAPALVTTVEAGKGTSLAVTDSRAYVAYDGSLKAFDLSTLQPLATADLWRGAFDVALVGSHAFVSSDSQEDCYEGPRGLQIVNLAEGDELRAVGRTRADGTVIGSNGAFAYTVTGWTDTEEPVFRVIDASSAGAPRVVGRIAFNHNAHAAAVDGRHVYLATDAGLEIIDASRPTAPKVAALMAMTGGVGDLQVSGNYCYMLGESDITIVDVSFVSSPVIVGSIEAPLNANRLLAGGNQLIVGAVNTDLNDVPLTVFDISQPTHPLVAYEDAGWCWELRDMALSGSYLCTVYSHEDNQMLNVYDISASAAPIHIGAVELYNPWEIASISGRRVFLAGGTIVDLSAPGAFKLLGSIPTAGYAFEGTSGLYVSADGYFQVFPSPCP